MAVQDQPLTGGRLRSWAGYLLGAACLAWVLHGVDYRELLAAMGNLDWGWVAAAVFCDILSYVNQGLRWQLLLRPTGRASLFEATSAIYMGLFANEVLPLRFGELVRAYWMGRRLGAGLVAMFPSLAVERLFDAVWLAAGLGLTAIFMPLPPELARAGDILGAMVLLATAVFVYFVRRRPFGSEPPSWKPLRWLHSLGEGLRGIGQSWEVYFSFAASLSMLVLQALAFWFVMVAYGLSFSIWQGIVVLLIVRLGTAIPNAPANVGTYQFFTVVGLALFGLDKTRATGFSFVVFTILTIPLWVLGLVALSRSGTSLRALRREITRTPPGEQQ